jgi:hypothetical protein
MGWIKIMRQKSIQFATVQLVISRRARRINKRSAGKNKCICVPCDDTNTTGVDFCVGVPITAAITPLKQSLPPLTGINWEPLWSRGIFVLLFNTSQLLL